MKRITALMVVFLFTLNIFLPPLRSSANKINFKTGNWVSAQQGVRFSIYDSCACEVLAVIDIFSETNYRVLGSTLRKGVNKKMAKGCKLQYLYQYQIVEGVGCDIADIPIDYTGSVWSLTKVSDSDAFSRLLSTVHIGSDNVGYTDIDSFKKLISQEDLSALDSAVFHPCGFYLVDDGGNGTLQSFDETHVLVIEPVFYFWLNVSPDGSGYFFYGSATEWAMYDEQKDVNHENQRFYNLTYPPEDPIYHNYVHSNMGKLTYQGGPAGIIPQEDITILLNGEVYEEDGSIPKGAEYLSIRAPGNDIIDSFVTGRTNRKIFEQYGVEVMKRKDFSHLTVDIVESNTDFRTGTTGMLSFKITSGGEQAYIPDAAEMAAGGEYYGLKFKLTTLSRSTGSGKYMPSMEINCDGLPSNYDQTGSFALPVDTLAFKEFRVPDTPGEWWFTVALYCADGKKEFFTTNTGSQDKASKLYCYKVNFTDSVTIQPVAVSAGSLKPKDFTAPVFDIGSVALSAPLTERTWSYYKASCYVDHEGNAMVLMNLKTETADGRISAGYAPTSYGNIPLKYSGGTMHTRSGYGIGLDVTTNAREIPGECTGYQSGVVLLPEYNYSGCGIKLEDVGGVFRMARNPDSMYYNDTLHSDYSRVHFTPVWYPDGDYELAVFMFDNWTPVGQLWDCQSYTVTINGTVYDDWYITRN